MLNTLYFLKTLYYVTITLFCCVFLLVSEITNSFMKLSAELDQMVTNSTTDIY